MITLFTKYAPFPRSRLDDLGIQVKQGLNGPPTPSEPLIVAMAWALKLPLTDEVIESGLAQDFDASLSGIGQELGAGAYSMR